MDRKNLLINGVICIILVFSLIAVYIFIPANTTNDSEFISSSTYDPATEKDLYFDDSTPKEKAISIARLNEGVIGFYSTINVNASLTSDGKYWIVKMHGVHDPNDEVVVTVDATTWKSKKSACLFEPATSGRSLDELKALYIAEIQSSVDEALGKPYKVTLRGKTVWKVPMYTYIANGKEPRGYIYVDLATGKSKDVYFDAETGKTHIGRWMTLKEVDDLVNSGYGAALDQPFKDALRDLYQE